MTTPVGVGVIGAGYWGTKLIGEYLAAERKGRVRLLKVHDPSVSALGALLIRKETATIGQTRLTQDISEVIHDPEISAVHIATPNHTHYTLAKMALEAGKDVLVEKPMTLKSNEAYELVDLADSRKRVLQVGHIFRYNAALQLTRQLLRTGILGRIFYVRIQWTDSCYYPDRDIIFDLGPHPIDVLNQLLNDWPQQLTGFTKGYRNSKDHEEVAYGIAEFPNDVFAHIELSWLHPRKTREATVVGSDGTLIIDCLGQHLTRISNGNSEDIPVSVNNTIESEITHFADCVAHRSISRESGLIGARTVEALETIRESMWERPLPIVQPIDHTAAMIAVLEMATGAQNQSNVSALQNVEHASFDKYAEMLLRSGFLRRVSTEEGINYEITESGSRFLKDYGEMQRDVARPRPKIREPS